MLLSTIIEWFINPQTNRYLYVDLDHNNCVSSFADLFIYYNVHKLVTDLHNHVDIHEVFFLNICFSKVAIRMLFLLFEFLLDKRNVRNLHFNSLRVKYKLV